MNATTKVKSKDLAPNLTCHICKGYFIDATTIIECLHSFCKSCIVKHLEKSEYCPKCDVQLHTTKPLSSIRSDQMLQEIVYKLVPGLFQNEMQRRRKFYQDNSESKSTSQVDSGHVYNETYITSDDIINLTLEYHTTDVDFRESTKRFIKCPAAVSISILKKLIQGKYDLTNDAIIEVMYGERILPDDFLLMDIAYKYSWTQNGKPLQLCYRVKGPASIFKTVIPKKSLTLPSSCLKGSLVEKVSTTTTMSPKSLKNSTFGDSTKKKNLSATIKKHRETNGAAINVIVNNNETPILNGSVSKSSRPKGENSLPIKNRKKSKNLDMNGESPIKSKIKDPNRTKSKQVICRDFATTTTTTTTSTNTTTIMKNNNNNEVKDKEVHLRISENGVICARNVASGEEKIIHGVTNGPTSMMSSASSASSTCSTTIVTPTNISAGTITSSSNGMYSNNNHTYLLGFQGSSNSTGNHNNNNTNYNHTDANSFPILTNKSLNNSLQYPVQLSIPIPLQYNNGTNSCNSVNVSNSPNLNINGKNNNVTMKPNSLIPTPTTTNAKSKNLTLSRKRPMKNNTIIKTVSEKIDKTKLKVPTTKRKLLGSNDNSNSSSNNNNNNANGNSNMETLKSVTKRLKEDLSTQNGTNYFSAEITPIVNPSLLNHKATTFSTCINNNNNEVGNSINNNNKRLVTNNQAVTPTTPFINGKFTPTKIPQSTNSLSSSPLSNSKIFPKGTNKSPSCSPKKPKFFKSRHAVDTSIPVTPTTPTSAKSNPNLYFGDLILNGSSTNNNNNSGTIKGKSNENIIIPSHSNTTTTTSTLPSYVNVSTNMNMNANVNSTIASIATTPTASIGSTAASTIRYPHSTIDFSNGVPLHVPILTHYSQLQNSPKHNVHNSNNIMYTNAYMNFAQLAPQLSIINNGPNSHNNNSNNINNNYNTSLDLSLSSNAKISSSSPSNTSQNNGNNFSIIMPHHQQQQQQKHISNKTSNDTPSSKFNAFSPETNSKQKLTAGSSSIATTPSNSTDLSSSSIKNLLNITPQQQHSKGFHNLGLGVNFFSSNNLTNNVKSNTNDNINVVTKNPRKSSSPAKIGRQNVNSLNLSSVAVKTTSSLLSTPEKSTPLKPNETNTPTSTSKNDSSCAKNSGISNTSDTSQVPKNEENGTEIYQTENNDSAVSFASAANVVVAGNPTSSDASVSKNEQENGSKDISKSISTSDSKTVTENINSTCGERVDDEGILQVKGNNNNTNNTKGQEIDGTSSQNSIPTDATKNVEQEQNSMLNTASVVDEHKTNTTNNGKTFINNNNNNNSNDMKMSKNVSSLENNNNSDDSNPKKVPETTT